MKRFLLLAGVLLLLAGLVPGAIAGASTNESPPTKEVAAEESLDFGDAPEGFDVAHFPTTLANNGARHLINPKVYLGQWVEADTDGKPHINAIGDDILDRTDDEDGVAIPALRAGATSRIGVTASVAGYLNAWFDFNSDGDWDDAGEYPLADVRIPAGFSAHLVKPSIEANPGDTYARFRFTTRPLSETLKPLYTGQAPDGEVEDYMVTIRPFGPDSFEPNDEFSQAVDLGSLNQSRTGLGIHEPNQEDWFKWTALSDGEFSLDANSDDRVDKLFFNLYDAEGNRLASSDGSPITWKGSKGTAYYVQVLAKDELVVGDYQLYIDAAPIQNYAVLFAGGIRLAKNFPRYYDNIKKMYQTLLSDFPISADHIWILYADGTNSAIDRSDNINSDMSYASAAYVMAGTSDNLETVLTETLPPLVDSDDHFLFYSFDHGGGAENVPSSQGEEVLCGWGDNISDDDLNDWLDLVGAGYTTVVHTQCFAGGMIDDLLPTASDIFAASATNHYEASWGNGFANAYADALINGHNNSYDAYVYAHDHDPYAIARGTYTGNQGTWTDGKEHPWASSTANFPILPRNNNRPPFLIYEKELKFRPPEPPWEWIIITYDMLLSESDFVEPDMDSVGFRIESVNAGGLLFKNGNPVIPGETTVLYGERLEWFPSERIDSNIQKAEEVLAAFSVRLTDGTTVSDDQATVSINMGSSSLPDAIDDQAEMAEDSVDVVIDVLDNDKAEEEGPLVIAGVGQPAHGTATIANGHVLYTPSPDFHGEDDFSYTIADASQSTDTALVTVKIYSVNDAPDAWDDTLNVMIDSQDNLINPLLNDEDADPDPLNAIPGSAPLHGKVVAIDDVTLSYTPDPGYDGEDNFTYFASDGKAMTEAAVRVNVVESSRLDWGDAPEFGSSLGDGYPTRAISDGARHVIDGPWLGKIAPDVEADGQPEALAAGDDTHGTADEDGVDFPILIRGKSAEVSVMVGGGGRVDAWIDWNANHMWEDPREKIYSGYLSAGLHTLTVSVPTDAVPGLSFARVRISNNTDGLTPFGLAPNGEVEDYAVTITDEVKVDISVTLQGSSRPDKGWVIPLTVKFFKPGANVLRDLPVAICTDTTRKAGATAIYTVEKVPEGIYDVTVVSKHTLINVKKNEKITGPADSVYMGTLLEGNANNMTGLEITSTIINYTDFRILAASFMKSTRDADFDPRADFDRNGIVDISDFGLLAVNYMKTSPVEVP
ncbi:MAG: Ig-like domain-containing protein [Dehalococcoidia bacterium]|nr:Ig-like domain-containing protein [Dehalococcoidia bacterium]